MKELSKLLTNESVISFADGTAVKGAEEVAEVIIRCCKAYNDGFVQALTKEAIKGVVIGVILTGTVIGVSKLIKVKNLKIKKKKESEA